MLIYYSYFQYQTWDTKHCHSSTTYLYEVIESLSISRLVIQLTIGILFPFLIPLSTYSWNKLKPFITSKHREVYHRKVLHIKNKT